MNDKGALFLCATPIGNLEDITLRVLRTLKEVDIIAAEDTRHTKKLLNHFEIHKPLISYYEHNKVEKGKYLITQLEQGKNIALVSDAGTPAISDPGEDLVRLCITRDINVTSLPGPVAAISALILSGMSTKRFSFEGFISVSKKTRKEHLNALKNDTRTLIFYEAPHKLIGTLKDMIHVFGNRKVAIARELTKKFEEIIRCTLEEAIEKFDKQSPKGEFVIIIEGTNKQQLIEQKQKQWEDISVSQHIEMYCSQGLMNKEALKKVAKDRGISKREVYAWQLKENGK